MAAEGRKLSPTVPRKGGKTFGKKKLIRGSLPEKKNGWTSALP